MKTTLAALTIGVIISSTPQLAKERLVGVDVIGNVLHLEWDTTGNGEEDLRVLYEIQRTYIGGMYTKQKPFMYYKDLNENLKYEKNEVFRLR